MKILTLLLFTIYVYAPPLPDSLSRDERKAVRYVNDNTVCFTDSYRVRLLEVIIINSRKYDLPAYLFARQLWVESRFKQFAFSSASCRGIGQIDDRYWSLLLYRVDNGELGRYLLRKNITNYTRFYYRIGYSVEMAAMIMRYLMDKFGRYEVALLYYSHRWGTAAEYAKDPYRSEYVKAIME